MDLLALAASALLPWMLGIALLTLLRAPQRAPADPGEIAWIAGAGYLTGAFALTLWMRALSLAGVKFSALAIALPLLVLTAACVALQWRRHDKAWLAALREFAIIPTIGRARVIWWLLLGWLAVRFALLGIEIATRPLYPWDAWTQWATKARVWYELGYLAPFARALEWLAANGAVYFDASPEYPPTMPLLQVWTCLCLGRWDDVLMNWPWWQIGIALTLAVYGGLRSLGVAPLGALVGAFLVASLPLANVHVALAGYADLPLAACYAAAALSFLRWAQSRDLRDAALALVLAAACTQIKNPGWFWAMTLVPGAIVVLLPRYGVRVALVGFAAAGFVLVALARMKITLFNYRIDLDYNPPWGDLAESYFLLGNWHLLWYGAIIAALLAGRELLSRSLAPLSIIVLGGLIFLFFVFGFTNASAYISDQTTVNRATLHLAPLIAVFLVLAFEAFARRWRAAHPEPLPAA
jgi:hypothetical protein